MPQIALHDSREWQIALDNLEQMQPRMLADLLKTPTKLRELLRQRVISHFQTLERMRESNPAATERELSEMILPEHLAPVNPNWQDQPPLTKAEKELLQRFASRPT